MNFDGQQDIAAARDVVWRHLNDPATTQRCIPGCKSFTETAPDMYDAVVVSSIGPVTVTFKGKARIFDRLDGEGYSIEGQGNGGVTGFGKMVARIRLTDTPEGTRLTYAAEAQIGGKLAQIGSRLIQSAAAKFSDDYFVRFREIVSAEVGGPGMPPTQAAPGAALASSADTGIAAGPVAAIRKLFSGNAGNEK